MTNFIRERGSPDLSRAVWRKSSRSTANGSCVEVADLGPAWRKSSRSGGNGDCVEVADLGAAWRKSSRSSANGACVEVADLGPAWRKSSRSGGNGDCVEVSGLGRTLAVRDSKNPAGPSLFLTPTSWRTFLTAVRANRL